MTSEEKQVLEWASTWAQAMQDGADASDGIKKARSSKDARDRLLADVNHRKALADFKWSEIALLDAVRAMWVQKRAR